MSIAAAIQWALESNLQGLVLDSGAVQEQSQAVAMARSKGLKVHKAPIMPAMCYSLCCCSTDELSVAWHGCPALYQS